MFKIDKPENFDVTLRVRRRQGQSNETQIQCPCQDKSVRIKLCNLPDHLKPSKKDRQTGHEKWMETLKISIQSIEQVARLVESNGFWKYKMGFQTAERSCLMFYPADICMKDRFVMTITITPKSDVLLVNMPPLVPAFLNDINDKLMKACDLLEPRAEHLDLEVFLLVAEARQDLLAWDAEANAAYGNEESVATSTTSRTTTSSTTTSTTSHATGQKSDSIDVDRIPPEKLKQWQQRRKQMAKVGIKVDADYDDDGNYKYKKKNVETAELVESGTTSSASAPVEDSIASRVVAQHEKKVSAEDWRTAIKNSVQKDLGKVRCDEVNEKFNELLKSQEETQHSEAFKEALKKSQENEEEEVEKEEDEDKE